MKTFRAVVAGVVAYLSLFIPDYVQTYYSTPIPTGVSLLAFLGAFTVLVVTVLDARGHVWKEDDGDRS